MIGNFIDSDLRLAALGIGPAPDEIEGRVRQAVDFFLHVAKSRIVIQQQPALFCERCSEQWPRPG
jgi:hypothetical protein